MSPSLLGSDDQHGYILGTTRGRSWVRSAVVASGVLLFLVSATGETASLVFQQYSTLRWVITMFGPLLLVLMATSRRPTAVLSVTTILAAPFEPLVLTFKGYHISAFIALLVATTVCGLFEGSLFNEGAPQNRSALANAGPWIVLCLLTPTVLGGAGAEIEYIAVFLAVAVMCTRLASLYANGQSHIAFAFVGSATVQAILAILERSTGHILNFYGAAGSGTYSSRYFFDYGTAARTTGAFFDPISLGNFLAMALPFSLLFILRQGTKLGPRLLAVTASIVLIAGLGVTLSRASWLAAAFGCVALPLFTRGRLRATSTVLVLGTLLAALVSAVALYGPQIGSRFDSIFDPTAAHVRTAAGDRLREQTWSAALDIFKSHPLLGVGYSHLDQQLQAAVPGSGTGTQAQNTYLQYLGEAGVVGGGALALLISASILDVRRRLTDSWLGPATCGALIAVGVTWVTDVTVRYTAVEACFAVLIGLAASRPYVRAGSPSPVAVLVRQAPSEVLS